MPFNLATGQPDFEARFAAFLSAKREIQEEVDQVVAAILAEVRERGDAAVLDYTARFDRLQLAPQELTFTAEQIRTAWRIDGAASSGRKAVAASE